MCFVNWSSVINLDLFWKQSFLIEHKNRIYLLIVSFVVGFDSERILTVDGLAPQSGLLSHRPRLRAPGPGRDGVVDDESRIVGVLRERLDSGRSGPRFRPRLVEGLLGVKRIGVFGRQEVVRLATTLENFLSSSPVKGFLHRREVESCTY
jgi:hypothetical protein